MVETLDRRPLRRVRFTTVLEIFTETPWQVFLVFPAELIFILAIYAFGSLLEKGLNR